jgi:hypothetical protein
LCHSFKDENSIELRPGIPGISSSRPISGWDFCFYKIRKNTSGLK